MNKNTVLAALAAAFLAFGAAAPSPVHAAGTYTQFLCADPDTGQNLGFADGLTYVSSTSYWDAAPSAACGVLTPKISGSVQSHDYAAIHYEVTDPKISIASAEHYGALTGHVGSSGYLTLTQHGGSDLADLAAPRGTDQGIWASDGVIAHGVGNPPFASANRHATQIGNNSWFTIAVVCETSVVFTTCVQQPGDWQYTFFGARVILRDIAAPTVAGVTGTFTSAGSLRGNGVATFAAADQGAGLYRWRLYDGARVAQTGSIGSDSDCIDVNTANSDDYEFARQHPCPTSMPNASINASVSSFHEGSQRIRLAIEDAAGNEVDVIDRTVTIDNVADPMLNASAAQPPAITGTPKVGQPLTGDGGWWTNAGTYAYAWERCDVDGTNCSTIPGATTPNYTPTAADANRRLRLAVTGSNTANESRTERSALTAPVPYTATNTTPTTADSGSAPPPTAAPPAPQASQTTATPDRSASPSPIAPPAGRLTVTVGNKTSVRTRYTATTTAVGRLTDTTGAPIPGATVTATAAEARPGAPRSPLGTATTNSDGHFIYKIGHGPSRAVTFTYNTTNAIVRLTVPAQLTLHIKRVRTGRTTWLTGRLAHLRRAGVKLEVQALDGKRWRTFDTTKTKPGGTYKYGYRFKRSAAGRRFTLRVLVDSPLYPFARAASKPTTVRVR